MHQAIFALELGPVQAGIITPVVSAVKYQSSGTAAVDPGRENCGQDADAVPAAPAPVAAQRISFAPAEPPKVMVFQTAAAASVAVLFHWLLITEKSAKIMPPFLLLRASHYGLER